MWLEELAPEARARKASLLAAWVEAAEGLRSAIHAHESERGPLGEALFPIWRGPSLRRHADQALAAETELQRRLGSAYVTRRLAELATQSAVGPALERLAAAGAAWAAERDRPALAGAEADEVRTRLLALAGKSASLLERVRWVARAALTRRADLLDTVFPKRSRPESAGEGERTEHVETSSGEAAEVTPEPSAPAAPDAAPQAGSPQASGAGAAAGKRRRSAEPAAPPRASRRGASTRTAPPDASAAQGTSSRSRPSGQPVTPDASAEKDTTRASRRRASAENAPAGASAAERARPASRSRPSGQAVTPDSPGKHGKPPPSRRRAFPESARGNASTAQEARQTSRRRPSAPADASKPEPRARGDGARRRSRPARRS